MRRLLPPLLVLLVLAGIGVRCAMEPSRAEAQARIRGLVQGDSRAEASEKLEAYRERYDRPEDAWFAAWAWFRLMQPDRAVAEIWDREDIAGDPGTARRFAETALYALGWEDLAREDATMQEPAALVVLVEGENAWADARLREHAKEQGLSGITRYFFPAYKNATSRPLRIMSDVFREREDERFHVAAAIGTLTGEAHADAARDAATLIGVIDDETWRRSFHDVWSVAAVALGRHGSPEAIAALEKAAKRLEGSVNEHDSYDRLLVLVGLLAAGDFEANEAIANVVLGQDDSGKLTAWYLEALIHRYLQGDERSEIWLRRMWEGPGATMFGVRSRIARAFLLQHDAPNDDAMKMWVGRMLGDLESPDAGFTSHMLARSFRMRAGVPEAQAQLIALLRRVAEQFRGTPDADLTAPFIEGLRALYLYGGD